MTCGDYWSSILIAIEAAAPQDSARLDAEITNADKAEILVAIANVLRPYLMEVVDNGLIDFRKQIDGVLQVTLGAMAQTLKSIDWDALTKSAQ